MSLSPRKVLVGLLACSLLLVAIGWGAVVLHLVPDLTSIPASIRRRVDMTGEATIPAWYSSLLLFAASSLLAVVALGDRDDRSSGRRETRTLFLVAAVLFVSGSLGVEVIGARVAESLGKETVLYTTLASVEEGLEMLGSSVFIYGLLLHLRAVAGGIRVRIE